MSFGIQYLKLASMWGQGIDMITLVSAPTASTSAVTSLAAYTFTANGNLTDMAGASSVEVGFYIGTNADYTQNTRYVADANKTSTGTFSYNATNLNDSTTYYVTAFANNIIEKAGATVSVSTPAGSVVLYSAGQTTGWVFSVCNCGTANGAGYLEATRMRLYAPWWGGTTATTSTAIDLTSMSTMVVDYSYGGQSYSTFSITSGDNSSQALKYWYTNTVPSGTAFNINFTAPRTISVSLGNANTVQAYVYKIEAFP